MVLVTLLVSSPAQLPLQRRVLPTNTVHEHPLSRLVRPCPRVTNGPGLPSQGQRVLTWRAPVGHTVTMVHSDALPCLANVEMNSRL